MQMRRFIVWTVSIVLGLASAVGTLAFFDTTIEKFAMANLILVFVSIAGFAFIWLDYFLKTEYLSS
jgi:hypothetical protein